MTVTVHRRLDSNTVCIPELQPLIGKDVQIIVIEETRPPMPRPDLTALHKLAGHIDLDYAAIDELRSRSMI